MKFTTQSHWCSRAKKKHLLPSGKKCSHLVINTAIHGLMLIWKNKTRNLQIKKMRSRVNMIFTLQRRRVADQ